MKRLVTFSLSKFGGVGSPSDIKTEGSPHLENVFYPLEGAFFSSRLPWRLVLDILPMYNYLASNGSGVYYYRLQEDHFPYLKDTCLFFQWSAERNQIVSARLFTPPAEYLEELVFPGSLAFCFSVPENTKGRFFPVHRDLVFTSNNTIPMTCLNKKPLMLPAPIIAPNVSGSGLYKYLFLLRGEIRDGWYVNSNPSLLSSLCNKGSVSASFSYVNLGFNVYKARIYRTKMLDDDKTIPEWDDFYFVQEVVCNKTGDNLSFSITDNKSDEEVLSGERLGRYGIVMEHKYKSNVSRLPFVFDFILEFKERLVGFGGESKIYPAVQATKDSCVITLSSGQFSQYDIGKEVYFLDAPETEPYHFIDFVHQNTAHIFPPFQSNSGVYQLKVDVPTKKLKVSYMNFDNIGYTNILYNIEVGVHDIGKITGAVYRDEYLYVFLTGSCYEVSGGNFLDTSVAPGTNVDYIARRLPFSIGLEFPETLAYSNRLGIIVGVCNGAIWLFDGRTAEDVSKYAPHFFERIAMESLPCARILFDEKRGGFYVCGLAEVESNFADIFLYYDIARKEWTWNNGINICDVVH